MNKNSACPSIYIYLDPIDYLIAMYEWNKSETEYFSVRKWASSLEVKHSTLTGLMSRKKKLSTGLIATLSQKFNLTPNEEAYFISMQKYASATTAKEQNIMLLVLGEMASSKGRIVEVSSTDIFQHWVYVAILVMAELPGFLADASFIKQSLSSDISLEVIEDGLRKLVGAGLLSIDETGNLRRTQDHVRTKNDVSIEAVHSYYSQVSDLAKESIKLPITEREFQCFSFAIDEDQLPAIKEAIREFRAKISAMPKKNAERVYHMNIQLFPVTRPITKPNQGEHQFLN